MAAGFLENPMQRIVEDMAHHIRRLVPSTVNVHVESNPERGMCYVTFEREVGVTRRAKVILNFTQKDVSVKIQDRFFDAGMKKFVETYCGVILAKTLIPGKFSEDFFCLRLPKELSAAEIADIVSDVHHLWYPPAILEGFIEHRAELISSFDKICMNQFMLYKSRFPIKQD